MQLNKKREPALTSWTDFWVFLMINQRRILRHRRTLELRKAELLQQRDTSAISREPIPLDQQAFGRISRVDAQQQQAMAMAQERQRSIELLAIERAFTRMKEDVYGYCEECGEGIAPGRLRVDPSVALCINCAGRSTAK